MASRDAGPILGLDHIDLVVEALDVAVAPYEGCSTRPARRGAGGGAGLGPLRAGQYRAGPGGARGEPSALARHVAHRPDGAHAALGALGFAVADPDGAARLLERRGLPAAGPRCPGWVARRPRCCPTPRAACTCC